MLYRKHLAVPGEGGRIGIVIQQYPNRFIRSEVKEMRPMKARTREVISYIIRTLDSQLAVYFFFPTGVHYPTSIDAHHFNQLYTRFNPVMIF